MSGLRQEGETQIELAGNKEDVFNVVLASCQAAGKVIQQNLAMGFISFKSPMKLLSMQNPVNLQITLKTKDDNTVIVEFKGNSLDGAAGFNSCNRVIENIMTEISKRI